MSVGKEKTKYFEENYIKDSPVLHDHNFFMNLLHSEILEFPYMHIYIYIYTYILHFGLYFHLVNTGTL